MWVDIWVGVPTETEVPFSPLEEKITVLWKMWGPEDRVQFAGVPTAEAPPPTALPVLLIDAIDSSSKSRQPVSERRRLSAAVCPPEDAPGADSAAPPSPPAAPLPLTGLREPPAAPAAGEPPPPARRTLRVPGAPPAVAPPAQPVKAPTAAAPPLPAPPVEEVEAGNSDHQAAPPTPATAAPSAAGWRQKVFIKLSGVKKTRGDINLVYYDTQGHSKNMKKSVETSLKMMFTHSILMLKSTPKLPQKLNFAGIKPFSLCSGKTGSRNSQYNT
ncbi:uncharacterized protein LOC132330214 [Haemorhous mexicanus]|uniref:uncharacterized protein LOC132330214 n=1 Tax=Haemorhous mexicanus TaxID=30427 RepID=UPI0028BF59B7|nr:uncharacterized protein LOC132330214 [Haemorhous mexicanus]